MKTAMLRYFLYILLYGYIFLLFLKGYYPANETGILFIGFLIFMMIAYTFAGSLINGELNSKSKEIYYKFESLLDQQYQTLKMVKKVHQNIARYKNDSNLLIQNFIKNLQNEINEKTNQSIERLFNSETAQLLTIILKEQINITKKYIQIAYMLTTSLLIRNRLKLQR